MDSIVAFYVEYHTPIFLYLIGGLIVNFMYDHAISKLAKHDQKAEELRFSILERFWVGILWPLPLTLFIINFIRTVNKND